MALPIMPKATAVWLVDNTTMSFKQIAEFTGLHELEVQGIADGEVAIGVKGFDPIVNNQLSEEELDKAQADPKHKLMLKHIPNSEGERKRKGPRYTPLSKRQDKPSAILWLVKNHPELKDSQVGKLVGTTKPTIAAIRERTHWNISHITPVDPVALGLCSQVELDEAIAKATKNLPQTEEAELGETLVSTEESTSADPDAALARLGGLENFTFGEKQEEKTEIDPDSLFNLPGDST